MTDREFDKQLEEQLNLGFRKVQITSIVAAYKDCAKHILSIIETSDNVIEDIEAYCNWIIGTDNDAIISFCNNNNKNKEAK